MSGVPFFRVDTVLHTVGQFIHTHRPSQVRECSREQLQAQMALVFQLREILHKWIEHRSLRLPGLAVASWENMCKWVSVCVNGKVVLISLSVNKG